MISTLLLKQTNHLLHCSSTLDFALNCVAEQWKLKQVWTYGQTHQRLDYLHTQSMDVDKGLDQNLDL